MEVNWMYVAASIFIGLFVMFNGAVVTVIGGFFLWLLKDYLNHRNKPIKGVVAEAHCVQCKGDVLTRIAEVKEAQRDDRTDLKQSLLANSTEHNKLFSCLSKIEAEVAWMAGRMRNGSTIERRSGEEGE